MSHLDIDTIIEYVMIDKINDETKALASKVGSHIRDCEECRELVNAYMCVYEGLVEEAANRKILNEQLRSILEERMASEERENGYYISPVFEK